MDLLDSLIVKNDLSEFIGKAFHICTPGSEFLPNWHIDLIAEYLEQIRKGQIHRLIVNMPPRYLKSLSINIAWPAWLLGHNPEMRIISASYAAGLSRRHSLDCKTVITSDWFKALFPDCRIAYGQNEKSRFATTRHGFRFATSIGGTLTGDGGDILIVDDPLNPNQAQSKRKRDYVNRWFDQTFSTRLNDKKQGAIIVVMQRLHEADLSGYLLEKGGWQHLKLPARNTAPKIYRLGNIEKHYSEREILHHARESEKELQHAAAELGTNAFRAQYQQEPVPENGAMLQREWLHTYSALPECQLRVLSMDTAIKSSEKHDASVCLVFHESPTASYLADVHVMRLEYPDLKKRFYELVAKHKPHAILLEDKASGQQLLQDAKREKGLPVIGILPKGDKITRFAAASAMVEAGRLHIPEEAPWLAHFLDEILRFPYAENDDQADALSQYLNWLRYKKREAQIRGF